MKRLFLLALLAGAPAVATANPIVTPAFEAGYLSQDLPEVAGLVFAGDVNHDGLLDVVTASGAGDTRTMFGAANGMFYALDTRSGQQLARIQLGGSVVAPPALGDGLIFVRADKIYALGE